MFAPIFVLIWIIPFVLPGLVTAISFLNGVPLYVYITAGFSTIIQLIMGAPFYQSALNSVKHLSANMDVLVVLGTTAAWGYGIILILVGYTEQDLASPNYMMQI
jgi:P-type Cu+ transporter